MVMEEGQCTARCEEAIRSLFLGDFVGFTSIGLLNLWLPFGGVQMLLLYSCRRLTDYALFFFISSFCLCNKCSFQCRRANI